MSDWLFKYSECILCTGCLFCIVLLIVYLEYRLNGIMNQISSLLSRIKQLEGEKDSRFSNASSTDNNAKIDMQIVDLIDKINHKIEDLSNRIEKTSDRLVDNYKQNFNDMVERIDKTSDNAVDKISRKIEELEGKINKPVIGSDGKEAGGNSDVNNDDLLSNKPWKKLMNNVFFIQDRINNIASPEEISQTPSDFIDFINEKFNELYRDNSLTPIQDEKSFDWDRHKPIDSQSPSNGALIEETIEPGWRYKDRIFKPAIVSTSTEHKEESDD